MYRVVFTDSYTKRAVRFLRKHPELRKQYEKTLQMLEINPFHPALRLHKLAGRLQGVHSVSINLYYRITLEFIIEDSTLVPINVGSHDVVY
jgi:mRNA-degrading endonuclease YafQ of YafQ-DinJ toxin-antitoxin module